MDGPYIDTGTQYQQGMPYVGQRPLFMYSENGDSRGPCPCEARKIFRCVLKHLVYERSAAYLWHRVQALGILKRGYIYIYICSPCATPFVPGYAWYSFKNVAPGGELPEVSDNELMEALFQHVGKAWQRHGMARHGIAMYGEVYRDIAWHGMVCRRLQIGIVRY